ncbi:hypothetical protein COU49_00840 [Candidatus Nomurabacteria bacterium CG10_big_fil_rev_8_21_14_0_10_35_16]|uniref:Uncharacterized protein n=1 Tax=Candidatus Nomurabacteria bacterium CG10_big_fil_rev_8_21_14_0_10_35_16 TaxID=1974731 RepID=A0A2H0TBV0_9BACT|nr:MAG: hypothetical protein COU49_00840 [Candidatus Nomurabacteria bacterium CG10_big_fil_rev_8_21_14_0_10_35_16]
MQNKKPLKKVLLFVIIIIACGIGLGFYYSSLPAHHPQDNQQNCESVSGQWIENTCFPFLNKNLD